MTDLRAHWNQPASRPALLTFAFLLGGLVAVIGPSLYDLLTQVWNTEEQGHGPIVLAVAIWLAYRNWGSMLAVATKPPVWSWALLVVGALAYAVGRSQQIFLIEVGAIILVLIAVLIQWLGTKALRVQWFAFFFMFFLIPLPSLVVETLTMPMKMGVSYAAEWLMHLLGYPISRSGVILNVGQYQLLVADACAGLHTLFTLEAMGLLYLNIVKRDSVVRNVFLAILIVPISFCANTIRVLTLCLITYHFGDEAGQGFLHGFAGMVLFMSALALIISIDTLLHRIFGVKRQRGGAAPLGEQHV
jgi:exosortase B